MVRRLIVFSLFVPLILASCGTLRSDNALPTSNPASNSTAESRHSGDVELCDLLQSPDKFEAKIVRVKGQLCDCFENGSISAPGCPVQKKIWVQGKFDKCQNAGRVDPFRGTSNSDPERRYGAWTFDVVAVGRLIGTKGGYGQMNQYDLLFSIDCLEKAERIN